MSETRSEAHRAASEKLADHTHEVRLHAMESVRSYGQNALKGLFLLNGGAPIAMLTFIASLYSKSDHSSIRLASKLLDNITSAMLFFGCGLVLSVVVSGVAYLNYMSLARYVWEPVEWHNWLVVGEVPAPRQFFGVANRWTFYASIFLSLASMACFMWGARDVFLALKAAAHQMEPHIRPR